MVYGYSAEYVDLGRRIDALHIFSRNKNAGLGKVVNGARSIFHHGIFVKIVVQFRRRSEDLARYLCISKVEFDWHNILCLVVFPLGE